MSSYLDGKDARDPLASPLYVHLQRLASIRVHVGDAEVLLGDSIRFVERAVAAGADARLDIWDGMAHGFLGGVGQFVAATASAPGTESPFLRESRLPY